MATKKAQTPAITLAPAMPPKKVYLRTFKLETLHPLKSN